MSKKNIGLILIVLSLIGFGWTAYEAFRAAWSFTSLFSILENTQLLELLLEVLEGNKQWPEVLEGNEKWLEVLKYVPFVFMLPYLKYFIGSFILFVIGIVFLLLKDKNKSNDMS